MLRVLFDDADADGVTSQSQWPPSGAPGGTGTLHWGLPDYEGQQTAGAKVLQVTLSGDSMLGGSTDCGGADYPDYFGTWGSRNFGKADHVNVQMQWDVADWPCYAKYYAAWSLGELPAGAEVLSATVELRQFGNPGFAPGYAEDGTKDTVMQVFEVDKPWEENTITWDTAPAPQENTSRTLVTPLPGDCAPTPYWYCSPGIAYQFDVTEIVRRAQAQGRSWASLALYTAAGQYHSGKYFYSREGAEPPVVRIAYLPAGARGARTAPPAQAPIWAPALESAWESGRALLQVLVESIRAAQPQGFYYVSPQGDDGNDGVSAGAPWRTFAHAWEVLQPGDTLLLLDGTYTAATTGVIQPNIRNGEQGRPITIKARNDGKALIDGEGQTIPVRLGENWGPSGPIGDWFVVEGIVARNGTLSSIRLEHAHHNVLRRVSAYDADPDDNSLAIGIAWSDDNLVEDFVAAGTGRYMVNVFTSRGNTLRRGFTMWQRWDGRHFCGVSWPNGNNVGVYNSSDTTVENVIAYGRGVTGIFIQANDDTAVADNNQILGSMALLQGADYDGRVWTYGTGATAARGAPRPDHQPLRRAVSRQHHAVGVGRPPPGLQPVWPGRAARQRLSRHPGSGQCGAGLGLAASLWPRPGRHGDRPRHALRQRPRYHQLGSSAGRRHLHRPARHRVEQRRAQRHQQPHRQQPMGGAGRGRPVRAPLCRPAAHHPAAAPLADGGARQGGDWSERRGTDWAVSSVGHSGNSVRC